MRRIVIHPTSASLLQARLRRLEEKGGAVSGRDSILFRSFREALTREACAMRGVSARTPNEIELSLLFLESVERFRSSGHGNLPGAVSAFSDSAWRDVLAGLFSEWLLPRSLLDPILDACARDSGSARRAVFARLFRVFEDTVRQAGFLLPQDAFQAVLEVLEGPRPQAFRLLAKVLPGGGAAGARSGADWDVALEFPGVRWLNPLQMELVRALARLLGPERVVIRPALPAEFGADSIFDRLSALLEDPAADEPIHGWARNIADAVTMQDPELLFGAEKNLDFSRSAGVYGEIEDLARRIKWEMRENRTPPHRIALIVRDIGEYSDAVADVFSRFGIPYFFRRGIPVTSVPLAKVILALAEFRAHPRRSVLCALLESPWLEAGRDSLQVTGPELADAIRRAGVPPEIEVPEEQLIPPLLRFGRERADGLGPLLADAALAVWQQLCADSAPGGTLADHARALMRACRNLLRLESRDSASPEDADPGLAQVLELNREVWDFFMHLLETLAAAPGRLGSDFSPEKFAVLLADFAAAATVRAPGARPEGVWVLTPFDAAGLRFDTVFLAGLNAGVFPAEAGANSVLNDSDREWLHKEIPNLPAVVLPEPRTRSAMEDILFLSALATAGQRIVLSYRSQDEHERELTPSVYFSSLWQLAGWAAVPGSGEAAEGAAPALPVSEYNRWRLQQPGSDFLKRHLERQAQCTRPFERTPFPGESFFPSVPLALACAEDEARQRLLSKDFDPDREALPPAGTAPAGEAGKGPPGAAAPSAAAADPDPSAWILRALTVEKARSEAPADPGAADCAPPGRGGEFLGALGADLLDIRRFGQLEFSPSDLEALAACPFRYFLSRLLRAEPVLPVEKEPDPRDQGTAVHRILALTYSFLAGHEEAKTWLMRHAGEKIARFTPLIQPYRAAPGAAGWELASAPGAGGLSGIRWLGRSYEEEYRALAAAVTDAVLQSAGAQDWNLGDPHLLELRRLAIREWVQSVICCDVRMADPAAETKKKRAAAPWARPQEFIDVPVLFEQTFGSGRRAHSSVILPPVGSGIGKSVSLRGRVDRIDLVFEAGTGTLACLRIIDYKGAYAARKSRKRLLQDVAAGLDCQLPAYGLAAAARFCSGRAVDWRRGSLEIPTYVQYIGYRSALDDKVAAARSHYLDLNQIVPEDLVEPAALLPVIEVFRRRVHALVERFRSGCFPVTPQNCDFCPYPGVCRVRSRKLPDAESA